MVRTNPNLWISAWSITYTAVAKERRRSHPSAQLPLVARNSKLPSSTCGVNTSSSTATTSRADHSIKLQACSASLLKVLRDKGTLHTHKTPSSSRVHSSSCKKGGGQQRQQPNQHQQATVQTQQQQSDSSNGVTPGQADCTACLPSAELEPVKRACDPTKHCTTARRRIEEQDNAEPAQTQLQSSAAAEDQPGL